LVIVLACVVSVPPFIAAAQTPEEKAFSERLERERQAEQARVKKQIEEQRELERQWRIVVPLDVQVVVSRFQGDKRVTSLPYALTVNAVHAREGIAQLAQIRMGAQVPLPTMGTPTVDGKPVTGMLNTNPVTYKEIGTFIDADAKWLEGGAFELQISVSDTSLYRRSQNPPAGAEQIDDMGLPVLRTFTASNRVVMKDGQTKQFMLAADRISGDTLRVDVTLKVAK
jgi:hypothetical protein